MATQPEERSLHRKLTEVMAAIDWQPKTGRNTAQGYNFVSVERIKDSVRGPLAKQHVMVYTSIKSVERSEFVTKSLTTMFHVTVQGEVTFADADSGEMFTVEAAGEAMDSGDKALNKAQTALVKYALINTFLIPTGDDPDAETPESKPIVERPRPQRPVTPAGQASAEPPMPESAPFAPLVGPEVPDDGQSEPKATPKARLVQCESKSPFGTEEAPVQCRREMGHTASHRTENESWT